MDNSNKKLYRSKTDKIISGVLGGLGKYLEIEPIIIRIAFVVLAVASGIFPMILVYVLFLILIPEENGSGVDGKEKMEQVAKELKEEAGNIAENLKARRKEMHGRHGRRLFGLFLILVGVFMALKIVMPLSWISWNLFWAGLIIIFGVYFFSTSRS